MMLRQYAAEHGLTVIDEYINDGWSGTNFDFQRYGTFVNIYSGVPEEKGYAWTIAQVQEQIASRRRRHKNGTTQIFSGLVKCADCGWSLAYGENKLLKRLLNASDKERSTAKKKQASELKKAEKRSLLCLI